MAAIHIFGDMDLFRKQGMTDPAQSDDDAFGPVKGFEQTQFRVTSRFRLDEGSMAYAAFDGIAIIQDVAGHEGRLVNLILFGAAPPTKLPIPRIIVYRGLRREDFLVGTGVDSTLQVKRPGNDLNGLPLTSDLIRNIQDHFADWLLRMQEKNIPVERLTPSYDLLGYMDYDSSTPTQRKPYAIGTNVFNIFYKNGRKANYVPFPIKKGWSLGRFDYYGPDNQIKVGIEVVLDSGRAGFTITNARVLERKIVVATPAPTDKEGAEEVGQMALREAILDFIDPAAFYNLHKDQGVEYRDRVDNKTKLYYGDNVYEYFINRFYTHNRIYVDLRNQHDSSLNYYLDNMDQTSKDKNFKVGVNVTMGNEVEEKYYKNFWPLYYTDATRTGNGENILSLLFRREFNPRVMVFHDIGITDRGSFFKQDDFRRDYGLTGNWTAPFLFITPNIKSLPGPTSTAWWIRVYVIRKELPPPDVNFPRRMVPSDNYLDLIFGPVVPVSATDEVSWYIIGGKRYVDGSKAFGVNVDLMVQVGIYEGPDTITFFAQVVSQNKTISDIFQPIAGGTAMAARYENILQSWARRYDAVMGFAAKLEGGTPVTLPALNPNHASPIAYGIMSVQFTRAEYNSRILPAAQLLDSNLHTTYISFDTFQEPPPPATKYTRRVNITVSGLNSAGVYTREHTVGGAVTVVTNDRFTFISETATGHVMIPEKRSNPNAYFDANSAIIPGSEEEVRNLIAFVEAVENAYKDEDSVDPRHTVTRLRHQYYGYASNTDEPFFWTFGVNPLLKSCVFGAVIPGEQNFLDGQINMNACMRKHRRLTEPDDVENENARAAYKKAYPYLTARADENFIGDNPSPFITDPATAGGQPLSGEKRKTWDLGHALFGLESLLYGGGVNWLDCDSENCAAAIFWPYPRHCSIFSSLTLASYMADIGPVPASYWMHVNRGKSTAAEAWYPETESLDREWEISASDPDLISDTESFGLYAAWLSVKAAAEANGESFTLSKVLRHYYDMDTVHNEHFTRRWRIFCRNEGFIDDNGLWIINNTSPTYTKLLHKLWQFSIFWCNVIEHSWLTGNMLMKGSIYGIKTTKYTSNGLVEAYEPLRTVLDRYLTAVQVWYDEERS